MGRDSYEKEVEIFHVKIVEEGGSRKEIRTREQKKVRFFGWEALDYVDKVKAAFSLS